MNDIFVVDYDPFGMDSRITVFQNGQSTILSAHSDIVDLADSLVSLSQEYGIYKMKVHATKNFFYELKRLTTEKEKNLYNNSRIDMEII